MIRTKTKKKSNDINIKYNISRANQINNYTITDFCNNIDQCDENLAQKLEKYNEELTHLFPTAQRLKRIYSYLNLEIWIFVTIVATLASWAGIALDYYIGQFSNLRMRKIHEIDNYYIRYAAYSGSMIICGLISVFICQKVSTDATGSGVPQLKTVLSGVKLFKFLELKVFFAKFIALFFSAISGVGTGKEGPLIHMSAMIGYNLSKLPFFKTIKNRPYYRMQMMNVAVAAGVTSTFGAPFGGIMFSVELCSTVFLLSNLWKLFVCGTIVKFWFDFGSLNGFISGFSSKFIEKTEMINNMPHYLLIGLICGWMGSLWIYTYSLFLQFKAQTNIKVIKNPYMYTILALWTIGFLNVSLETGYFGNKGIITSMWVQDHLYNDPKIQWPEGKIWASLFNTYLVRFVCIMLFATCPFPNGVSLPSITQGAILGRLYGEILRWYRPEVQPQSFSMIGAAAYAGVMTRTTSVALLIAEITGQTHLLLGIMIASLCAYGIANIFTMSAFNTVLTIKKMPYLPFMFKSKQYKKHAGDYHTEIKAVLTEKISMFEVLSLFLNKKAIILDEFLPVVDSSEHRRIIGSVRTENMLHYLEYAAREIEEELKATKNKKNLKKIYGKLTKFWDEDEEKSKSPFGKLWSKKKEDETKLKKFAGMPQRMIDLIDELKRNQYSLDFTEDGIKMSHRSKKLQSALKEKFLIAMKMIEIRKKEVESGAKETKIKVKDEYYLFLRQFLVTLDIDWDHPQLRFNSYPICVDKTAKMIKVHYLFQMLGVDSMFVADRGKLVGRLKLETFLNSKYKE